MFMASCSTGFRYSLTFSSCALLVIEFVVTLSRLPAGYDLCHSLNLSPSLHGLQTPTLFATNGSENYLGTFLFLCVSQQRLIGEIYPAPFFPLVEISLIMN